MIVKRYPKTFQNSLQAWNASDELITEYIQENNLSLESTLLINDRFGFLACALVDFDPISIVNYKSQEKSLRQNLINNDFPIIEENIIYPFDKISKKLDTVLLKIPKSINLFELQLQEINNHISAQGTVVCGFMTKYFTPQIISIVGKYFDSIEQTQAKKKARLLVLKQKKKIDPIKLLTTIEFNNFHYKQYFGVFSSDHIDYGTQFLLEHLTIEPKLECILDLASGNGVIAHHIRKQNKTAEIHLTDDNYLAVESSKMNINDDNTHHHFSDCLENFPSQFFDLAVSNPPFHFEHENNIEVSLSLFKEVEKKLKPKGQFILVANKHLNYKTHLEKLFQDVTVTAENEKFIIYNCSK